MFTTVERPGAFCWTELMLSHAPEYNKKPAAIAVESEAIWFGHFKSLWLNQDRHRAFCWTELMLSYSTEYNKKPAAMAVESEAIWFGHFKSIWLNQERHGSAGKIYCTWLQFQLGELINVQDWILKRWMKLDNYLNYMQ